MRMPAHLRWMEVRTIIAAIAASSITPRTRCLRLLHIVLRTRSVSIFGTPVFGALHSHDRVTALRASGRDELAIPLPCEDAQLREQSATVAALEPERAVRHAIDVCLHQRITTAATLRPQYGQYDGVMSL